jgi:hypothetical protein
MYQEKESFDFHYEIDEVGGVTRKAALYGDKKRFMTDVEADNPKGDKRDDVDVSEIIHFWMPNGICDMFGVPDWIAAMPIIDLIQSQQQYWYDYFQNWGSIAKFLSITSLDSIDDAVWTDLETAFTSTVKGDGAFKTFVANLVGPDIKVQVHDLGGNPFEGTAIEADRNMALDVASSHRTPPALAHIVPSAKNISSNKGVMREEVDVWQAMVIGPRQKIFITTLERTLGVDFPVPTLSRKKQEVSGISQEMVDVPESGWTLKRLRDEMEFDMTPQLGGPGKNDTTENNKESTPQDK